jgi:hypothetical protein
MLPTGWRAQTTQTQGYYLANLQILTLTVPLLAEVQSLRWDVAAADVGQRLVVDLNTVSTRMQTNTHPHITVCWCVVGPCNGHGKCCDS